MVAAAFTGTLIFQGANGEVKHIRATMTDVAAAFWAFPDGNDFLALPSHTNWTLRDMIIVTGGTDTLQSEVYANGLSIGLVVDHKSNLNTSNFRQMATAPITFRAGSVIKFKQAA